MTTQEKMNDIFKDVGNDFRYGNITVEFSTHKKFKITWQNTLDHIDFQIFDYMEDASDETIGYRLARTVFSMVTRKSAVYEQTLEDYCIDPDFISNKQPICSKGPGIP